MRSVNCSEVEDELDRGVIMGEAEMAFEEPPVDLLERFQPERHTYLKLSILMKNDNLGEVPEEFVFSKDFGRVDSSQMWNPQDRVIFGRDAQPRSGEPSLVDINLRQNNRVSHQHCQLLLRDGWKQPRRLTADFLEFLKIASTKENPWSRLPHELYRLIWSMFDFRPIFYIQDIGSKFGTFLKLTAKTELSEGRSWV